MGQVTKQEGTTYSHWLVFASYKVETQPLYLTIDGDSIVSERGRSRNGEMEITSNMTKPPHKQTDKFITRTKQSTEPPQRRKRVYKN